MSVWSIEKKDKAIKDFIGIYQKIVDFTKENSLKIEEFWKELDKFNETINHCAKNIIDGLYMDFYYVYSYIKNVIDSLYDSNMETNETIVRGLDYINQLKTL